MRLTHLCPKLSIMSPRRRYRRKPNQFVIAVQLRLDTAGFSYRKWGDDQFCKAGDWLVDNEVHRGAYVKTTPVWAETAEEHGRVATKEGHSHHAKGDYLVFNNEDGTDGYAVSSDKFHSMYEPDD